MNIFRKVSLILAIVLVGIGCDELTEATAPPTPTGFTATAGMEQVVLNWTLSSDTSVTGYKIYQDSNKTGIAVSGRETITHTVTGLTAGTEYSFTITAVAGSSESAKSEAVKATPKPAITIDTNIATPTGFTADSGAYGVSLLWTESSDTAVTGYRIYQDGKPIHKITDRSTSWYFVTGLTVGTEYSFTVSAVVGSSESTPSEAKTATRTPVDATAPQNLRVTAVTATTATLSWDAVAGATGYNIYANGGIRVSMTATTGTGEARTTAKAYYLTTGKEYIFTIRVRRSDNTISGDSEGVKATPR